MPEGTRKALLVAGGIGVPPVLCLAGKLAEQGVAVDCVWALAPRPRPWESMSSARCAIRLTCALTTARSERTVSAPILPPSCLARGGYDYVASCGPAVMMKKVAAAAAEAGAYCEVSLERMMSCGFGACNTCNVETVDGMKGACIVRPRVRCFKVVVFLSGYREHGRRFRRRQDAEPPSTPQPVPLATVGSSRTSLMFRSWAPSPPRVALPSPGPATRARMAEIPGGMINSVGLQNPAWPPLPASPVRGSNSCPRTAARSSVRLPATPLTSLSAHSRCMSSCAPWAAGYEIGVSCPNIAAGGAAMGSTPEGASSVMAACRKVTDKPLFVKMAPVNVAEIAKALGAAGADGLSVINSIQGMAIDVHTRKSRVAKPKGRPFRPAVPPSPCAWSGRSLRPSISPSTVSAVS